MKTIKTYPTQEKLQELFYYCNTGNLFRRFVSKNNVPIDESSGTITISGYVTVSIDDQLYYLHRLIYIYHNGDIPKDFVIDHKSSNKYDNRIENLQAISVASNAHKQNKSKNNTSGYKGVSWNKNAKKWKSSITYNNRKIYLGYYKEINDAALAYNNAAIKYYGEHANLNVIEDSS